MKITNPNKRDQIVKECLKTKKNIQDSYLAERLGDINVEREMTKMFRPITEAQKDVKESLLGELKPIRTNLKELPAALTFPQLQALTAPPEESEDLDTSGSFIGPIAEQYLRQFASEQEVDKTFGICNKDGQFYIGDSPIEINDNNITVKGKEYLGTRGLWELLIMKEPDQNMYTEEDMADYTEILEKTSAMKHGNNPAIKNQSLAKDLITKQ